jgi:predicted RNase H-like nuclease
MYFVGVDLAWGQKKITGLAVVDAAGRLLAATQRKTDDEILDWLKPWTAGHCVVAIDAPIIVTNPTGNRPCESLVSRYFGKYNASCHPANLSKPHFANGTRALRLADQLGLAVDPQDRSDRRAVEVYPHPAIVVLFDLPRILQYKHKPGRNLEHLRGELLRLLDYLEGLDRASPPLLLSGSTDWQRIRRATEQAERKVDLAQVEDSIDAVVCAYIAAYSEANPTAVRLMGDPESGYILTPVTADIALQFDSA